MSLKLAIDRLGVLSVTGVTNFGLDDTPGMIHKNDLPALVIDLATSGGAGIQSANIGHSKAETTVAFFHRLLVDMPRAKVSQELIYQSLAHVDNYFTAIKGDMTMNGNLSQPLRVLSISFGWIDWYGVKYYGVSFYHNWVLVT
jgi:hypothetical protein